jgi:septal ring factor EnvC (AmiA/AmiB activator)
MTRTARHSVRSVVLVGLLAGASGCDWWPPALQERIGQQEQQLKVLQAEKARLQAQVTEMSKKLEDVKTQTAQMEQANNALTTQVQQLTASLAQAEAKAAKPTAATKRKK